MQRLKPLTQAKLARTVRGKALRREATMKKRAALRVGRTPLEELRTAVSVAA
jgi:hypothetical protein